LSAIALRQKQEEPRSVIAEAYQLAVPAQDTSGMQEELDALLATEKHLLPMEERAKARLKERVTQLDLAIRQATFTEKLIPLEVLGWRWPSGLPKVAPLSLGLPGFNITARNDEWGARSVSLSPTLPEKMAAMYADVMKAAESRCVRAESMWSCTYTFDGMIPMHARKAAVAAQESKRYEQLFMLVETPEKAWKIEKKRGLFFGRTRKFLASVAADPIIVGWAAEAMWVIEKFDLTTLEQYIADEFSQPALPPGK
jgi:hypothetical protein